MNIKKNILKFTVSMDKNLLDELLRITGQKKKSKAVNIAGREFAKQNQEEILFSLKGNLILRRRQNELELPF